MYGPLCDKTAFPAGQARFDCHLLLTSYKNCAKLICTLNTKGAASMNQQKQQRAMPKDGWCRQRTRGRLSLLLWAALFLALTVVFIGTFFYQFSMDKTYWDTGDYVLFYASCPVGLAFSAACIYAAYTGIRDAFFPEKSRLAKSIRSQLPFPDEAPPVGELFAMVDNDIRDNGLWFDNVAVGKEWVLGDDVSYIPRIRAVFGRDEIRHRHSNGRTYTSRIIELYILDDRHQPQVSSLKTPSELPMLIDCLKLRAPDALFKPYAQYTDYLTMSGDEWDSLDREYRNRKAKRASNAVQAAQQPEQNMVLTLHDGSATSRVTAEVVRRTLRDAIRQAQEQDECFFNLTPGRPPERDGVRWSGMQCAVFGSQLDENRNRVQGLWIYLVLVPVSGPDGKPVRNSLELSCTPEQAETTLLVWLRGEVPDLRSWEEIDLSGMKVSYTKPQASSQSYPPKLVLFSASGAGQSHERFTREDVQVGADGIVDGSYQQVDLTLSGGYLWIQVKAGDKTDGRCTVTATWPDGEVLRYFTAKCTHRQAAAWLMDYCDGKLRPGGADWKDITKKMTKK